LIVGDKPADMEAGRRAGLAQGWLVDGQSSRQGDFVISPLRDRSDLDRLLAAVAALGAEPGHA
jgi:D-glycero-D-manno-heptose 1,7-bisphosphate phosphatase